MITSPFSFGEGRNEVNYIFTIQAILLFSICMQIMAQININFDRIITSQKLVASNIIIYATPVKGYIFTYNAALLRIHKLI